MAAGQAPLKAQMPGWLEVCGRFPYLISVGGQGKAVWYSGHGEKKGSVGDGVAGEHHYAASGGVSIILRCFKT